jgi:polyribonucleotide nucleotidyltransferase
MLKMTEQWVKGLVREVQVGEVFEGEVKRILPFGAFVEVLPGKEGMVHVSKMSTGFVKDPNDIVKIGQTVKVRVAEIDEQGRINLSMLFGEDAESKERQPRPVGAAGGSSFEPRPQSEHPLAMQFRRERRTTSSSSDWRSRSTTSRPARPSGFSKDRKPRY